MRHDLLQVQANRIAQLEATRSQHSGGIRLEIRIDSSADNGTFHSYSVATFGEKSKRPPASRAVVYSRLRINRYAAPTTTKASTLTYSSLARAGVTAIAISTASMPAIAA